MRSTIGAGVRACCVALTLVLASAFAADEKPSIAVGATRDQVLRRYGEPRSIIAAGGREIYFYEQERIVFRNGVVTEIEPLAAERRGASPTAPAPAATTTPAAPPAAPDTAAAPETATPTEPAVTPPSGTAPAAAAAETATAPRPADAALSASQSKVSIKLVRPPTGAYVRPPVVKKEATPKATEAAAAPATAATERPSPTASPAARDAVNDPRANMPARDGVPARQGVAVSAPETTTTATPAAESVATVVAPSEASVAPAAEPKTTVASNEPATAETVRPKKKRPADADTPPATGLATRSYVIIGVIAAAVVFLIWRLWQRQLELVATSVSHTPFTPTAAAAENGARFTPELLSKLEWKRFEELVAAYYGKTGVVATRTKTGPASPVHINISWKGETRPFALVQCIAQRQGLVDVKPLQELYSALESQDIRRGYVVTSAKFNIPARDFAEEKHLTLLPGDMLLEKLNALPDSARAEIMQEITTGDLTTPSCPKCEAKMVPSPEDPETWQCPTHRDVKLPR
ncbi:MAG: restriction endonuclease [Opitutaceae bacterium]|nr:restriction endonuclease [Opitutaceae bacterium]